MLIGRDLCFGLHLDKLQAFAKIGIAVSLKASALKFLHTYIYAKVGEERVSCPALCKFRTPFVKN